MLSRAALFLVAFAWLEARMLGQIPAEERTPITDPDRLEKLGYPKAAKNVFLWSRADTRAGDGPSTASLQAKAAETWGPRYGYTTVFGYELQGYYEVLQNWSRTLLETQVLDNESSTIGHVRIEAPEGARLLSFEFWAYDTSPTADMTFRIWEICQPYGTEDPDSTIVAESSTLGANGNSVGSKTLGNLTVDNQNCVYTAQVVFPPIGESEILSLRKLRFSWARQVSPAPETASFGDVPTSHPFFQFVEALRKAGITLGCGGENFCPDAPLTRGQMAVFLSKALGLQWP